MVPRLHAPRQGLSQLDTPFIDIQAQLSAKWLVEELSDFTYIHGVIMNININVSLFTLPPTTTVLMMIFICSQYPSLLDGPIGIFADTVLKQYLFRTRNLLLAKQAIFR